MEQALTLPPEYREPLLLRCVRALSYQQISEILELPVTTIETRLARARKMLREEVGEIVADGFA
jgi:RNA polymerase sigma-70 factor (ECF subfamily)